MILPSPIQNLIAAFSRLPGIGPKTASRLTFFLLNAPQEVAEELSEALHELKANTVDCPICYNVTSAGRTECEICASTERYPGIDPGNQPKHGGGCHRHVHPTTDEYPYGKSNAPGTRPANWGGFGVC